MNCRACQYPLWRIRDRRCPECGTPFSPADFDFVRFAVRFRCPHCGQEYYGDGERGRLVPEEFDCVGCGRRVSMAEMVVEPAAGVEEKQTRTRAVPWLERDQLGLGRAFVRTIGMAMFMPGELAACLPRAVDEERHAGEPASMFGPALRFMLLTQAVVWAVAAVPLWTVLGFSVAARASGRGGSLGPEAGVLLVVYAAGLFGTLAAGFVFALIGHLLLRITGRRAGQGGLRRTLTAMAYSSGANALTAVPCFGVYFGWVWWVGSATVMLAYIHPVRPWRAAVAAIGPLASLIALAVGVQAWSVYLLMSRGGAAAAAASAGAASAPAVASAPAPRATAVGSAMLKYAAAHGDWPGHVAELLADGTLPVGNLTGPGDGASATTAADVRLGGLTGAEFALASPERRAGAARAAAASVAPSSAAYRVGDFVVCVHAGQPVVTSPDLWLLIASPDPDVPGNTPPSEYLVTKSDGGTVRIAAAEFDGWFAVQNIARLGYGLPPLPHPRDVHQPRPPAESGEAGGG